MIILRSWVVVYIFGQVLTSQMYAQSATLFASPNPCIIPGGQSVCTTTLSWFSQGIQNAELFVKVDNNTNIPIAIGGPNDQVPAPWIQAGHTYVFTLYDYSGGSQGAFLASANVTGQAGPASVNFSNATRPSISPHFVVADTWSVTVTNAPPNALIQVQWDSLTGQHALYSAGYTNSQGNFSTSSPTYSSNAGRWTGQWYVNGVPTGGSIGMQVIQIPTRISATGLNTTYTCAGQTNPAYGIGLRAGYYIEDNSGQNIGDYEIPITPVQAAFGIQADVQNPGVSYGFLTFFSDGPLRVGICNSVPISSAFAETLYLKIGTIVGASVRNNTFYVTSTSPNHGRITNTFDIDESN